MPLLSDPVRRRRSPLLIVFPVILIAVCISCFLIARAVAKPAERHHAPVGIVSGAARP